MSRSDRTTNAWGAGFSAATCPTGCGRAVRYGQLLCPACWSQVPYDLQRAVYRAWRAYNRDPSDELWEVYRDAREAVLASL